MRRFRPMKTTAMPLLSSLLAAVLLVGLPRTVGAQDQVDPPGRVARLNYMQGSVSFQPAGTKDWVDASPNRPLTTGDNLWVDQNSRGEVHVGSTALRLSSQTGISFLNLNDQAAQIQLAQGSIDVHVRALAGTEAFEVDTPNLALSLLRPGDYRMDVDPNGSSTVITVRAGAGEVTGGGKSYSVNPGQQYVFSGTEQLDYDAHPAPARDVFDRWSVERDQLEERSASARYVSREVIGYEDLDTYGEWRTDPEYGPVWIPRGVEVGWAPYHYGRWVYVAPWGWTWIESEPWGFAPFHYGRWAIVGGGWAWCPGPAVAVGVVDRPYYAPALVGFVGGGGWGVSLAIGGGAGVAWFPLGPRDVWVPGYRASQAYVRNVNITNTRVVNVTQVTNVYNNYSRNVNVSNNYTYVHNTTAVTAVSSDTFVNGQAADRGAVRLRAEEIEHPHVMQNAPLQPTEKSYLGSGAAARIAPPPALANRRVVTKMTPPLHAWPTGNQPLANGQGGQLQGGPFNGSRGQFQPPLNSNTNATNSSATVSGNAHPVTNFHPPSHVYANGNSQPNIESGTHPNTSTPPNGGLQSSHTGQYANGGTNQVHPGYGGNQGAELHENKHSQNPPKPEAKKNQEHDRERDR
jgi:hypothetical protein